MVIVCICVQNFYWWTHSCIRKIIQRHPVNWPVNSHTFRVFQTDDWNGNQSVRRNVKVYPIKIFVWRIWWLKLWCSFHSIKNANTNIFRECKSYGLYSRAYDVYGKNYDGTCFCIASTQTLFTWMCTEMGKEKSEQSDLESTNKGVHALDANLPFYQSLITTLIKGGEKKRKHRQSRQ